MLTRISLAALLLGFTAACSSSSSPSTPTTSGSAVAVSIVSGSSTLTSTAYAPNPITVAVGGTVTWTNNDTTAHTATANSGAFSSGTIAPSGKFSMTFPSAGSFPYRCTLHPGMVGTVTVQ